MSLPASLTTDCGGLLNRRGPGRKRCCHTEALHAGYYVYSSHGWFLSRIIELSNWFIFTRRIAEVTVFSHEFSFCPELSNLRIGLFSHGASRRSRSYCPEFANCRIFLHTENRGESRGFVTRLVLWTHRPTGGNYRISFFTRRVTESLGIYVTNYRIIEFLFTRRVTEVFFVTRHVLCHEFANWFLHAECRGWSRRL